VTGQEFCELMGRFKFRHTSEADLQRAIAQVLTKEGVPFRAEVKLGPRERIDFLLEGGCGVEVKVKGSATQAARQLQRYARSADITELVLVTSRSQVGAQLDAYLGKPVRVHMILGGLG